MNIDRKSIETIRFLAVDAVNRANSGHPGLPMGAASMAYVLFKNHLRFSPERPEWQNRDRFVLSAGHGSMLLYAILHLYGYDLSLDELKNFRQLGSKTPGHPEYGMTPGVETTTGPLGQGFATAVGMAMAEARQHARFPKLIDHHTYVLCGDGDLMEGVAHEAASLAGHLGLNKLIVLYDSNQITIDGRTDITFTEDVRARFSALEWNTILVEDGNDLEAIDAALTEAKQSDKPTLIELRTRIGYGSPNKEDKSSAHGAPLGVEETKLTKQAFGWDPEKDFVVEQDVKKHFDSIRKKKEKERQSWENRLEKSKQKQEFLQSMQRELPKEALQALRKVAGGDKPTRIHGQSMIQALYPHLPGLFGGSADLAASNMSDVKDAPYFSKEERQGVSIHFGIREFAMADIVHGINLHGGFYGYGATFLVFADYMKAALRLGALMKVPSVFLFTHDSIGVGEDGPTHQPVDQLPMLRSIPGLDVYRPADGHETAVAFYQAFSGERPAAICLSRQKLPELKRAMKDATRGGYIVRKERGEEPELILMASGSELQHAVKAAEILKDEVDIRVVSFLSMEHFERQRAAYKEKVLPTATRKRLAMEAASPMSWYRYVGLDGNIIAMESFGESAPGNQLFEHFGFTSENLVKAIRRYMKV